MCLERSRVPISLDLLVGEERDTELGELLEDTGISPEDYVIHSTLATEMERLLAELTPQQQEVLILHFGLLDGKSLTLDKIAPPPQPQSRKGAADQTKSLGTTAHNCRNWFNCERSLMLSIHNI